MERSGAEQERSGAEWSGGSGVEAEWSGVCGESGVGSGAERGVKRSGAEPSGAVLSQYTLSLPTHAR